MKSTIQKLYLSNFLVGLVFWYGIEKLFLSSIGLNALQIGIGASTIALFTLVFDVPSGFLADKWSRKGTLIIAFLALATGSMIIGFGSSFSTFIIGYLFYGLYIVGTSGTYQAIMYDSLHEEGRSSEYSKVMGKAYAMFLVGAGVANIMSGLIAQGIGYRWPYFLSIIPAILNVVLVLTIVEPKFHKLEQKEKIFKDSRQVMRSILTIPIIRAIIGVLAGLTIVELFKTDFSQLLMLRYSSSPIFLGIFWALFAFAWATGGYIAHKLKGKLDMLLLLTALPLLGLMMVDRVWALGFFLVQSVAYAAFVNLAETTIQDSIPSRVRASVMSYVSFIYRLIALPAGILLGWQIRNYGVRSAVVLVSSVGIVVTALWFMLPKNQTSKT